MGSTATTSVSEQWAARLKAIMPYGSSTCGKARLFPPEEPGAIVKGRGCRMWDADNKEYIDFRNALGPVSLGYCYPAVDKAITQQLKKGISFSHPHPLEAEVAEMLCKVIPCAEQARFLKTGGEAVAACIRLARAATGRDHVIQVGYNGWLNGIAAGGMALPGKKTATRPGIPESLALLHHAAVWNDLKGMEAIFDAHPGQVAAVVIAADYPNMEAGKTFYPAVRALAQKHGALLVFDEIVTGFRIAKGGVQEYFKVIPDLAVFAKGMANGMPLSVYCGKKEIMQKLDTAIVTSTLGGETLSLAACKAVLSVYDRHDVCGHMWKQGKRAWEGLNGLFKKYSIPARMKGFYPCCQITFDDGKQEVQNAFMRAAYRNGVCLQAVCYVCYSHRDTDITEALSRLEKACREM